MSREPLNDWQRLALAGYADGDFVDMVGTYSYSDEYGDSLLSFVLAELSDNEECEDIDMAIDRIQSGIDDLNVVLAALVRSKGVP
jgi:hypothetical protein